MTNQLIIPKKILFPSQAKSVIYKLISELERVCLIKDVENNFLIVSLKILNRVKTELNLGNTVVIGNYLKIGKGSVNKETNFSVENFYCLIDAYTKKYERERFTLELISNGNCRQNMILSLREIYTSIKYPNSIPVWKIMLASMMFTIDVITYSEERNAIFSDVLFELTMYHVSLEEIENFRSEKVNNT